MRASWAIFWSFYPALGALVACQPEVDFFESVDDPPANSAAVAHGGDDETEASPSESSEGSSAAAEDSGESESTQRAVESVDEDIDRADPDEPPPSPSASSAPPIPRESAEADPEAADEAPSSESRFGACPALLDGNLASFDAGGEAAVWTFGDFETQLSGGTYAYPGAPSPFEISSSFAAGDWHLFGTVGDYSGFGLFFDCTLLDASAFEGIAFRVEGESSLDLTLVVGTAADEISSEWSVLVEGVEAPPNSGRCFPDDSRYDGSCQAPRLRVRVPPGGAEVEVRFSDLAGGAPLVGVDPAEITSISWAFAPPPGVGTDEVEPYDVDLRLDDLRFF